MKTIGPSPEATAAVAEITLAAADDSPLTIAERMMGHPLVPMLGCEHVQIAAGAFTAALRNSPYGKGSVTDQTIREVLVRAASQTADRSCALTGVCGIAPAIGACFSVFLGTRFGNEREQRITMEAAISVSRAFTRLAGPACCKAYVRTALTEAVSVFGERFGIVLPAGGRIVCRDHERNPGGCAEARCPYFEPPSRDIFAEGKFVPGTVCTT